MNRLPGVDIVGSLRRSVLHTARAAQFPYEHVSFLKVRGGYGFGHALPVIGNSPAYCISWAGLLLGKDCVLPNAREDHEVLPPHDEPENVQSAVFKCHIY